MIATSSREVERRTSKDGGDTDIRPHDHVAEEEPARDEGLPRVARRATHDGGIGRVEAESGSGESICTQRVSRASREVARGY